MIEKLRNDNVEDYSIQKSCTNEKIIMNNSEEDVVNLDDITEEDLFKRLKTVDELIYEDFEKKMEDSDEFEDLEINEYEEIDESELDVKFNNLPIPLEQAACDYKNSKDENIRNDAFNYLYDHYMPKLERLGYRKNDDELAQELSIVLERAANTFDIKWGTKFNTYYWKCARNHMGTLNIRRNAKKRTAKYGIISMQQTVSNHDMETEIGAYIKDEKFAEDYKKSGFYVTLQQQIFPHLKESEIIAIKMHLQGHTLEEIGQALGGITAPAVHVKLRRLAKKRIIGTQLKELYKEYIS